MRERAPKMQYLKQLSDEIVKVIKAVAPSIVEIRSVSKRRRRRGQRVSVEEEMGVASGVIIRPDGVIVTNHHVVHGSDQLSVCLPDHRMFEPDICGADPVSDIAVLRVPASDLVVPKVRFDDPPQPGEIVFAVGSPLGFTGSVSMGVVSTEARFEFGPSWPAVFIQADIAINEGNSGGALLDCKGFLIGINSWTPDEGQGLAFAIPIKRALRISEKLLKDGEIRYGDIGVWGFQLDLPADLVKRQKIEQSTALMVEGIESRSPAAKAGIHPDDWIISLGDRKIESLEDFLEAMEGDMVGKEVAVKIVRGSDGSLADRKVKVEQLNVPGNRKQRR
jgi:S1-C subfamily serine protease